MTLTTKWRIRNYKLSIPQQTTQRKFLFHFISPAHSFLPQLRFTRFFTKTASNNKKHSYDDHNDAGSSFRTENGGARHTTWLSKHLHTSLHNHSATLKLLKTSPFLQIEMIKIIIVLLIQNSKKLSPDPARKQRWQWKQSTIL